MNYKQIIIARKDLNMSSGKLAAQVAHGAMAFLNNLIIKNTSAVIHPHNHQRNYYCKCEIDTELFDEWLTKDFTKIICEAKNKNHLLRAAEKAQEIGLRENEDFFIIKDKCYTELSPEESDGTTITVIGFKPMPDDTIGRISKKYQLWRD